MFWLTPSIPKSGGPPSSQIYLFLLVLGGGMVVWCERRIFCLLILIASSLQRSCRSAIHLPSVSQSHYLTTFGSRLLPFVLDSNGGNDPLDMFPIFFEVDSWCSAPSSSVVFRRLLRLGNFPAYWRLANVTSIRKVHPPPMLPITDQFLWQV